MRAVRVCIGRTLLICLALGATSTAAVGVTKTKACPQINGCATVLSSTTPTVGSSPAPGAVAPRPSPSSRFGIAVRTAPTAQPGAQSQSGNLIAKVNAGRGISCRGYKPRDPSTFVFKLLTATPLRITYEIVDRITNTTADGIQFCLAANFGFRTASGAPAVPTTLPDGTQGHIGLLPRCVHPTIPPGAPTRACVASIRAVENSSSSTGVDVIITARVPTLTAGDPWGSS